MAAFFIYLFGCVFSSICQFSVSQSCDGNESGSLMRIADTVRSCRVDQIDLSGQFRSFSLFEKKRPACKCPFSYFWITPRYIWEGMFHPEFYLSSPSRSTAERGTRLVTELNMSHLSVAKPNAAYFSAAAACR